VTIEELEAENHDYRKRLLDAAIRDTERAIAIKRAQNGRLDCLERGLAERRRQRAELDVADA
jgi:hypothetical protein